MLREPENESLEPQMVALENEVAELREQNQVPRYFISARNWGKTEYFYKERVS